MTQEIYNTQDVIDSRDVIERINDLESTLDGLEVDELQDYEDEQGELKTLLALQEQCEGYSDWKYGEGLIRDSYFEEYAQQLAEDIGAIDRNAQWPCYHIDWEAAANSLKMDYACVDFDGEDYWIRS